MRDVVTNFALPEHLAIHVERRGMDRGGVQKVDEQPAAITRDGRARGRRIDMFSRVGLAAVHLGLPDEFPTAALEAEHGLGLFSAIGCGEIDTVAHNGWRSMPAPWYRCFPQNVIGFAPVHWWRLAGRRDAVPLSLIHI